jgi:hypothetical protein
MAVNFDLLAREEIAVYFETGTTQKMQMSGKTTESFKSRLYI